MQNPFNNQEDLDAAFTLHTALTKLLRGLDAPMPTDATHAALARRVTVRALVLTMLDRPTLAAVEDITGHAADYWAERSYNELSKEQLQDMLQNLYSTDHWGS